MHIYTYVYIYIYIYMDCHILKKGKWGCHLHLLKKGEIGMPLPPS